MGTLTVILLTVFFAKVNVNKNKPQFIGFRLMFLMMYYTGKHYNEVGQ